MPAYREGLPYLGRRFWRQWLSMNLKASMCCSGQAQSSRCHRKSRRATRFHRLFALDARTGIRNISHIRSAHSAASLGSIIASARSAESLSKTERLRPGADCLLLGSTSSLGRRSSIAPILGRACATPAYRCSTGFRLALSASIRFEASALVRSDWKLSGSPHSSERVFR